MAAATAQQTHAPPLAQREAETLARRAAYERESAELQAAQASNLSWWEVDCPANMVNVQSLGHLQDAVEGAGAGTLVVVNFFAPECYACKSLQPKLRQIARNNPDVLFLKLNGLAGDLKAYCEDVGITRIPFFHFYRANKRVAAFAANMRPEKLALLRAEIAVHKQQAVRASAPQHAVAAAALDA